RVDLGLDLFLRGWAGVRSAESTAQLFNDCLRELGLDREHVFYVTRVIFRPEFFACIGAGEPGRDPNAVAGFADTSLDQMRYAEFLSNLLSGRVLAFEGKGRSARGHVHSRNFLEHG